jgi:hypothetical protein
MDFSANRAAGLQRLGDFIPRAGRAYANSRNYDDGVPGNGLRQNVSQLSPWLHAGLLSEAEVCAAVLAQHSPDAADKFIAEVFWRIYFRGYLEQRPTIWRSYCNGRDAAFVALESNAGLRAAYAEAIEGRTGIAAFDHWTRELTRTGYLHNHARMWFASIWIFTLKLDWQLGADFFLAHLIDGDAASNTLSWRWVAGLHTKGKTYLARADNIARYTANQQGGPLAAEGLASDAPALEEARDHERQTLDFPRKPGDDTFEAPYALILHDEAASHVPLDLPSPPVLVIGAARPGARSPGAIGAKARDFANDAVASGVEQAKAAFGCQMAHWHADEPLAEILTCAATSHVVLPYLPVGWTRDALLPDLSAISDAVEVTPLLADLNRATWPHAKAGFFGVKTKVASVLGELGIAG